jgi:type 1 glutamine amidotransferase
MRTPRLAAILAFVAVLPLDGTPGQTTTAEKRVLVVTTTAGFRHSSIETAERIIGELARRSGVFTVDYARVDPRDPQFRGPDGRPDQARVREAVRAVLAEKMSAEALQTYDAVIFANTTGDLPLPDPDGFLNWIRSGKGFIGMHAATDTLPGFPAYTEMIGGHFLRHGPQVEVEILKDDPRCAACSHLAERWTVFDEIYLFKDYERARVHNLLSLDRHPNERTPGHYPISWQKAYGSGRVFYTSLGHREDVWDPEWTDAKGQRRNAAEVSRQYQQHILGGIRWALG